MAQNTFNPINILDTTDATGIGSGGSLTIGGGASIGKDFYVGGNISISGTTTSFSDNIVLINKNPTNSCDTGLLFQRFTNDISNDQNYSGILYSEISDEFHFGYVSSDINRSNATIDSFVRIKTNGINSTGSSNTLGNIFTTGGSVGIGTTSPATDNGSRLSIVGSAFDSSGILRLYPSTFGQRAVIGFHSGQTSGSHWTLGRQNASNEFALSLSTNTAGMYFFANGNVSCGPLTTTAVTTGMILATTSISSGALYATNSTVTNFVATSITAGTIFASNNVNAAQSIVVQNTNSGSSAYSALTVATDQSNFNIFKNSSTRTVDGGANTTTIRNDGGPLRLQSNTGMGIWVGSTGNVGINTTTPSTILNVSGDTVIQGGGLTVKNSEANGYGRFELNGTAGSYIDFGPDTIDFRTRIIHQESDRSFNFLVNGATNVMTLASTGNVGIGTNSPTANLNVSGNTDLFGTLRVGASSSSPGFLINLGTSGVGGYRSALLYGDGTNITFSNQQNGYIVFATNNTDRVQIAANGRLTIGGNNGSYPLTVFGSSNSGNVAGYAGWYGNYGWQNQTTSYDVSIYSQNFMMAGQGFVSVSDQRIKKDIIEIEDGESLSILRQIEPKRYRYIDEYKRGTDYVYGFIAQQVRGVLPAASGLVKDFIPSIMTSATVSYDSTNDITTVTLVDNKQHNLTSENSNSRVRFFDENDMNTDLELHEIVSGDIFKVKGELKGVNTFVYGVEVDDFHTLNKDAIFTVAVAALQEVDRQLQEEKQKVSNLETELATLQQQYQDMLARIINLESK